MHMYIYICIVYIYMYTYKYMSLCVKLVSVPYISGLPLYPVNVVTITFISARVTLNFFLGF